MAYNYVEQDGRLYDQKLSQGVLTQPLETPNVNWLNGQTFTITSVTPSGYQPHTRNKGFNPGTLSQSKEPYTLEFDRDIEFYVDRADVDETDQALSAANISSIFITEKAQPEVDAYRFSKMAQHAITASGQSTVETITPSNAYTRIKEMIRPVRKYGPGSVIAYLSSEYMDALERSPDFTRIINVATVGGTNLESRVASVDGVRLVEVWDEERFGTKYDFTDGFVLASDGAQLNALIVAAPAIICKAKFNSVYLHEPGSVGQGDGYLYQNRLYHDLFILKNKSDAVIASIAQ